MMTSQSSLQSSNASTAQAMACSMFSSSLNIGMTSDTDGRAAMLDIPFLNLSSIGDHLHGMLLDGHPAGISSVPRLNRHDRRLRPHRDLHHLRIGERQDDPSPRTTLHLEGGGGAPRHRDLQPG